MATAATPLLAGFSLATIAVLLTETNRPALSGWAVAALVCAAAALLFSMQFNLHALKYGAAPSVRLDFWPEGRTRAAVLQLLRRMQAEDMVRATHLAQLGRVAYNLGLIAFLTALLLLTIPSSWNVAQIAACAAAGVAVAIEVLWVVRGRGLGRPPRPKWLRTGLGTVDRTCGEGGGSPSDTGDGSGA